MLKIYQTKPIKSTDPKIITKKEELVEVLVPVEINPVKTWAYKKIPLKYAKAVEILNNKGKYTKRCANNYIYLHNNTEIALRDIE